MNALIQKLKAFFARLTNKVQTEVKADLPKVEAIVAGIADTVKRLEQAAEAHVVEAAKHAADIVVLEAKKLESEAQTKLANSVADNIRALLTPKV